MSIDTHLQTLASTMPPLGSALATPAVAAEEPNMSMVAVEPSGDPQYLTKDEVMAAAQSAAENEVEPEAELKTPPPYFNVTPSNTIYHSGGVSDYPQLKFSVIFNVYLHDGSLVQVSRTFEIDSANLLEDALKQQDGKVIRVESVENKNSESQAKVAKRMRELAGIPHRGNFV